MLICPANVNFFACVVLHFPRIVATPVVILRVEHPIGIVSFTVRLVIPIVTPSYAMEVDVGMSSRRQQGSGSKEHTGSVVARIILHLKAESRFTSIG